jgi:predicted nucleic acid-binding protein
MPDSPPPLIYLDSCVYLYYLEDDPDRAPVIGELFSRQRTGEIRIITSVITQVEVAFDSNEKESGTLDQAVAGRIDELWAPGSPTEIIELEELIARRARRLVRYGVTEEWSLKPHDAIHLATAAEYGASEVYTYDERWPKFSGHIGAKICEPYNAQETLELGPGS